MGGPGLLIAIDGPAGAGKSTVAHLLAARLGLRLLDTGAMYRALAVKALRQGVTTSDAAGLAALGLGTRIAFSSAEPPAVLLDGEDVSEAIRTLEVGQTASELSVHHAVRAQLVAEQRAVIADGGYILEGRDVTTVVAPHADLKIFLTASIEERARRRWVEMQARGEDRRLQQVVVDVVERDHRDYSRSDSPLTLAEDARVVETYGLSAAEVAEAIAAMVASSPR